VPGRTGAPHTTPSPPTRLRSALGNGRTHTTGAAQLVQRSWYAGSACSIPRSSGSTVGAACVQFGRQHAYAHKFWDVGSATRQCMCMSCLLTLQTCTSVDCSPSAQQRLHNNSSAAMTAAAHITCHVGPEAPVCVCVDCQGWERGKSGACVTHALHASTPALRVQAHQRLLRPPRSSSTAARDDHVCAVGAAQCVPALIALELFGGAEHLGRLSGALQPAQQAGRRSRARERAGVALCKCVRH
jgi:hypothetical protein